MTADGVKIMKVAADIEGRIGALQTGRKGLEQLARDKARSIGEYDKAIQIAELRLKDEGMAVGLIKGQAKGKCYKERVAMELADALYKIQIVKMAAVQAELNGFQSIYRYLDAR